MTNNQDIQSTKNRFGIIGTSPALNYAINVATQVAATDLTVLITGESGSGKESFSKIIHSLSARKHGPFIAINCGAIPEGTIDSELFGHIKGSFTGAIDDRKGYFETTNGGTIFLDEIGEMPLGTQARLLRVLENGDFIPVGSSKVKKTDTRVVAATNRNLLDAVHQGRFREDLYYRLNTVPIMVPPLRERGNDIELLFRKFTTDFAERYRIRPIQLTDDAKAVLVGYAFPGNIRQLKNIAEQISILESEVNKPIDGQALARYLPNNQTSTASRQLLSLGGMASGDQSFSERELLYKVLFDMRRDVTDLKKLVLQVLNNENGADLLNKHRDLFTTADGSTDFTDIPQAESPKLLPTGTPAPIYSPAEVGPFARIDTNDDRFEVEDVAHETAEEESLWLEDKEKEMIVRALKKHNYKRKYAAQALGISERTLYRKIKQYDIEDE